MLDRFKRAASAMRPRTLTQIAAGIEKLERLRDDVGDLRKRADGDGVTLRRQEDAQAEVSKRLADISATLTGLSAMVASLDERLRGIQLRTDQLTSIERAEAEAENRYETLDEVLQADRVCAHAMKAITASELHLDPFPYIVVDEVLPEDLYEALVAAIPPRVLFDDRPINKQQIKVPPPFAPAYARRVWRFLTREVVERRLRDAVIARFRMPLADYLERFWPGLTPEDRSLSLIASDGRIILRRAGYVIPPHRDPKWGFITVIVYLARPGDPETWGTQLYRVRGDVEAPSAQPHYVCAEDCELVKDIQFTPNRALMFLNSNGSHGASIPPGAPADFERYIYQWRIGPHPNAVHRLKDRLTPEARALWEGKERY